MKNNANIVIAILVLLVLVLGSVVAYTFAVKPFISGYVTKTYNQEAADALSIILGQVQQQGYVEIPLGNGKSLFLVPAQPQQSTPASSENSS